MPGRERIVRLAVQRGERLVRELAQIGLEGRLNLGLPRREVAASLDVSESRLARWEHAEPPHPDIAEAGRWLRMLGQDLVLKAYPVGAPLRDIAHARLVSRLLELLHVGVLRILEAPIPTDRDLRAWDVLMRLGERWVGVACETRLRDWQDLIRREQLKMRDGKVDHLLLVLSDTHANRIAVRATGIALTQALPVDGRTVRAALKVGRDPGGSGILFL